MKIFREQLKVIDDQCLDLAGLQKILSAAPARDSYAIDLWYLTDETDEKHHACVHIAGTGHLLPSNVMDLTNSYIRNRWDFIGTCVMSDELVWHVFTAVDL